MSLKNWHPNPEELLLWLQYVNGVTKNNQNKTIKNELYTDNISVSNVNYSDQEITVNKVLQEISINNISGIDYKTIKKIDTGNYNIDIEIDLHGYSLDESFTILERTIIKAWNSNLRLLLVITGKGRNSEKQSIKSSFVNWMNTKEIRPYVLRVSTANKKHGGEGAFYVLLKRIRNLR